MTKFTREEIFERTIALLGRENFYKLTKKKIALFGLGGVGSFIFDALIRSGVENFLLVDYDTIEISNINRQLLANLDTLGKYKVDAAMELANKINPEIKIGVSREKLTRDNIEELNLENYDYIVDAIDDVKAKIGLISLAEKIKVPIISAMGGGYKLNPSDFKVSDIYETKNCPLARKLRKNLRQEGVTSLKVVYSEEEIKGDSGGPIPTISFVPSSLGLLMASEIIKDLINLKEIKIIRRCQV